MDAMQADLQVVLARVEAVDQRVRELKADVKADAAEKHADNVARLGRIEDQVRATNGRVSAAEAQIRGLWARLKELGRRKPDDDDGGRGGITRRDVTVFAAGAAGPIAAWKFAEWAFHLLKALP